MGERVNERGNRVIETYLLDTERYSFDRTLLPLGWKWFDTDEDASYFGIWVHPTRRRIKIFAEGDVIDIHCETVESFRAELVVLEEFHGPSNGDRFTAKDLDAMPAEGTATDE
jgi:hypothetical protein